MWSWAQNLQRPKFNRDWVSRKLRIVKKFALFILTIAWFLPMAAPAKAENPSATKQLQIIESIIEINGKEYPVFDLIQKDGSWGFTGQKGELFDIELKNSTREPV